MEYNSRRINKRRIKRSVFFKLLFLCLGLTTALNVSANMEVVTRISNTDIFLSDSITVEIDVNNANNPPKLKLPNIPFALIETSKSKISSSSSYIINGKMTKSEIRTFHVQVTPHKIGELVIPPIKVIDGNKSQFTPEYRINVETPPASEHMYLEVIPDKNEIFENETVTFRIKWYLRTNVEDYQFLFHPFEDIEDWEYQTQPIKKSQNTIKIKGYEIPYQKSQSSLKGYEYTLYTMDVGFRVLSVGKKFITPPVVVAVIENGTENRMDLFGRVITIPKKKKIFALAPSRSIMIHPLPEDGKPKNYRGAVGNFSLSVNTDVKNASTGDKIPVSMTISGEGYFGENNEKLPQNDPELVKDFGIEIKKIYPVEDNTFKTDFYFIPKNSNIHQIPALTFSYFDPETETYMASVSQDMPLSVTKQQIIGANDVVLPGNKPQKPVTENKDNFEYIDDLKLTAKNDLFSDRRNIMVFSIGLLSIPFLGFLFGSLYLRRKVKKALNAQIENRKVLFNKIRYIGAKFSEHTVSETIYDEALECIADMYTQFYTDTNNPDGQKSPFTLSGGLRQKMDDIKNTADFMKFSGAVCDSEFKNTLQNKIREFFQQLNTEFKVS